MDVELSEGNDCPALSLKENRLFAIPVAAGSSGIGLPYAPEDWPCPGDRWRWKVGNRKSNSGHWVDRYIYAPPSCPRSGGKKHGFPSRTSLEEYIRKEFPQVDVNAFFSSFIWRVPCADHTPQKGTGNNKYIYLSTRGFDANEHTGSELAIGPGDCKAGNVMCNLQAKEKNNTSAAKNCDVCCSEAGFCRDCCCILCSKTVDWACGGYSFIRCETNLDDHYICGHVAHVECALRSYMAGTVGGSIGLDVEYYCRRCDNKTDLMPHVTKLLKFCESLDSREDMEKILNLGFCILHGSEQKKAKNLQNHIGLAISKLKRGVHFDEIWKVEDDITTPPAGDMYHNGNEIKVLGSMDIRIKESENDSINKEAADGRVQRPGCITSDYKSVSAKLEGDIDQVLCELKRSQELEYRIAEQKLYVQKDFLLSLYRQLDYERSELANPAPSPVGGDCDALLSNVLHRVDQIKHEEEKLRKMMKIACGFGRTPKSILGDHYGIVIDD